MNELTLEITNFCPNKCKFCSSSAVDDMTKAINMTAQQVRMILRDKHYDQIHISGGEPLANKEFYVILQLCKWHSDDVIVHTNAIDHIAFNVHVLDNIYVEAYTTISPDVDKLRVLKRVVQGREKVRPEVHFSSNWEHDCQCNHEVVKPDGTVVPSPCRKEVNEKV